jgi:hypothetical protein
MKSFEVKNRRKFLVCQDLKRIPFWEIENNLISSKSI